MLMKKIKKVIKIIKEDFLVAPITIIIGFLFFILFIWTIRDLMFDNLWINLLFAVIFSVPCIYYFIITKKILKDKNDKQKKNTTTLISVILITTFILYYAIFSTIYTAILVQNPSTNIKSYRKVVSSSLTDIFPKEIPKSAKDVKVHFSPAFLQAGTEIILYYKDTDKSIKDYVDKFTKKAKWIGTFDDNYNENDFTLYNLKTVFYRLKISKTGFTIYLFNTDCDDSGWCNHGEYKAVFINEKTNEIIFSFEEW